MPRGRATVQICTTRRPKIILYIHLPFSILDLAAASYSHFYIGIFGIVAMDPTTEPTALPAFLALPTHLRQPFLNAVGNNPLDWLLPPTSGEVFESSDQYLARLQAY